MVWTGAATVFIGTDGSYLDADDAALELLGVASVEQLRSLPPDVFAGLPPDPAEQEAFRKAYYASRAQGVLGEGALRRLDGELVRVRTAILEEPDGRFRALFYVTQRPTTDLSARVYRIGDVLGEWRAAERRLEAVDLATPEGAAVMREVDLLRAQYQELVRQADRRTGSRG
jgi:PAS domain-containing protein